MEAEVNDIKNRVLTEEKVLTREILKTALKEDLLSEKEELVLRMSYKLGLEPGDELSFRGQDKPETKIKLAMIEKALLDYYSEEGSDDGLVSLLSEK